MTLRISLLLLVALAGCSHKSAVTREVKAFPATVDGGYRLGRTFQVPLDGAPPMARNLGLVAEARASYDGPTPMTVVIYEMKAQTSAFELMQKWPKPQPVEKDRKTGKGDEIRRLYFQKGALFVVTETNGEDSSRLRPFTDALEKAIQP